MPQPTSAPGPFQPTWESLSGWSVPGWYVDGKFGIFIHWGAYSVPGFGSEWYPRNMYLQGTPEFEHHRATYGPHSQFGYKDFLPLFRAERYDPRAWAALFREAGARFVVPVAEHHDGFPMYDSALSPWTAAKMGPCRDVLGELADAVRAEGMVLGVSSHRAEHWFFMNGGRAFDSDVSDPRYADFYGPAVVIGPDLEWNSKDWVPRPHAAFLDDWLARCCELVDRYRPQLFWFDWWIEQTVFQPYLQKFAAYYYNRAAEWGLGAAINFKNASFPLAAAVLDIERGQMAEISPRFWQNDTSVSKNSWGYVQQQDYKQPGDIIADLVDVVSKNGALLLNIGPRPDGAIPEPEQDILRAVGRWLAQNGEAIYGTRPWQTHGEGPTLVPQGSFTDTKREPFTAADLRYTARPGALYITALGRPDGQITARAVTPGAARPARVDLLGGAQDLAWRQDEDGLVVKLPESLPGEHAWVLRVTMQA